jgi:hypothetical protein
MIGKRNLAPAPMLPKVVDADDLEFGVAGHQVPWPLQITRCRRDGAYASRHPGLDEGPALNGSRRCGG